MVETRRSSDHLLLLLVDRDFARLAVPGKLSEYLPSGRPTLGLTYDGETKKLIERYQAGWVVDPDDPEAIKRALAKLIATEASESEPLCPSIRALVEEFSYDRQAERLADVFDSVIRNGR